MGSKDVKGFLKSAKECMDKKEYAIALQHCKNALKSDKQNYMALILFGACLQESDQVDEAPKAYKRACTISPDLPLAWKGLASYYEKQNRETDRKELLQAYLHLLKCETDMIKVTEWARKIGVLLSLLDDDTTVSTWNELKNQPGEKRLACMKMIFSVIGSSQNNAPNSFLPMYEEFVDASWCGFGKQYYVNIFKKYLKLLYIRRELNTLLVKAKQLYVAYPEAIAGPEWFCKGYLEAKFGTDNYEHEIPEPSEMYSVLLQLMPESYLGFACKGVDELACHDFIAACDSLSQAVKLKPSYGIAWYLLTQGQTWLYRFPDAEFSARKALENWKRTEKNTHCINNCKYWLAKALSEQNISVKAIESLRIADEFIFDGPNKLDFLQVLIKSSIKLKDNEKYEKYMMMLGSSDELKGEKLLLQALWWKEEDKHDKYKDFLNEASKFNDTNFEIWLELGKMHYNDGNTTSALRCILKATKLNEWCPYNYRYLGLIYQKNGDLTKARRCYQKAFLLSSYDFEAGIGLSDVYRNLGMQEENLKLLTTATQVTGARWAWLQLGLHYLAVNNPVEAVNSLRVAVRLNSDDRNAWECLADAYLALGSYNSAIKAYQKVINIEPDLVYPTLQIAIAKHLQEQDEEAVIEFRNAINLKPDYLPALHSHAISCLALARTRSDRNLNGLAADSCQEAVKSLSAALNLRKDLICLWKLLGDCCIFISKFPPKYCKISVPSWLWESIGVSKDYVANVVDILQLAIKCYCHVISLNSELPDSWLDLAINYYCLANFIPSTEGKAAARYSALSSVKKCLMISETNWMAWNLLGCLCVTSDTTDYPLAQHAFSVAINLDCWNPVAWCNLGCLYLIIDDLRLANICFTEAQRCNPDYVQSWVGQAMLAEITGHHEAMDLYRHSTQLGFHPEGSQGYANFVLNKLLKSTAKSDPEYVFSITNMNAEITACDGMCWYVDRYPMSPSAFNMLGLLFERLGLHLKAADAFSSALNTPIITGSSERDKLLLNYGRILVQLNRASESIDVLKQIKEASFESECVLALAYVKSDQLSDAYGTYQSSLEWLATDDSQKSHILVAMAGVVYEHQGYQDAKLLLMQACQLHPVSVQGLFSCCALGLLHSDLPLTELALKELHNYRDNSEHTANIALLQAYTALIKGEGIEARRSLSRAAHRHPEQAMLWLHMGVLLLHLYPDVSAKLSSKCFNRALYLGRSIIDVSKLTSLVSLSHHLAACDEESIRSARHALHLFPAVAENWIVLVASIYSQNKIVSSTRDLLWLKKAIRHIQNSFKLSEPLHNWLDNCNSRVSLLVDKILS